MRTKQGKLEKKFWQELVIHLTDSLTPKYTLVAQNGKTTVMNLGTANRTRSAQLQSSEEVQSSLTSVKIDIREDMLKDIRVCFDKRQSNTVKWGGALDTQ
jgi:hypothetical protein